MDIQYKVLSRVEASESLTRLFRELTGTDMIPDTVRINSLIGSAGLAFCTAWVEGELVGMTSVVPCRTALYDKLWIEDVVVLSEFRGLGIGRGLLEFAMEDAVSRFSQGAFWLTSNPSREAARRLYASLGFRQRETGVFFREVVNKM